MGLAAKKKKREGGPIDNQTTRTVGAEEKGDEKKGRGGGLDLGGELRKGGCSLEVARCLLMDARLAKLID
jgi:hypothetical protein